MSQRTRPQVEISARCACGAVTVAVKGTIYSMFMCSCEDCQKASGTGHSSVALADRSSVTVTGEVRSFTRPADSGATFSRCFCPVCGTPLFGTSSRRPDTIVLAVGFFAGRNDWFDPNQLIFARSRRDWDVIADHLPRHDTYRQAAT